MAITPLSPTKSAVFSGVSICHSSWTLATILKFIAFSFNILTKLILEFYTPGEPNSGWIHCSYTTDQPRKQFLHAYKSEGKTKYKPVIGKARDLV